jgi:1-acyl-sn-glycerol-3-phosphate acyltransferase
MSSDDTELAPRRWFHGLSFLSWLIYRFTWLAILPVLKGPIRLKGFNHRGLPQTGGMLLLSNHLTLLDPFMVGWLPFRPSRFMASSAPLRRPLLGRWLRALGAFPKNKFVKDRSSMEELQRHFDDGQLITLFPEGTRSWDGRTLRMGEGIGRLIKRLDSPVLLSRMVSAHYFWPRWARYPRFVPVHIEYEGPLTWPENATAAEITADIQARLTVEQRIPEGYSTAGFRMAHGLSNFLWACPSCFATSSLDVHRRDGNQVVCVRCWAQWKVEVDTTLRGHDDAPSFTIREAHDRVAAHFGERPVADPEHYKSTGVVLHSPSGKMLRAKKSGSGFDLAASGRLRLTDQALEVFCDNGLVQLSLPFAEIRAVSVELGNNVQLRATGELYRMVPGTGSVLMWGHFVHTWRRSVQGLPFTPVG